MSLSMLRFETPWALLALLMPLLWWAIGKALDERRRKKQADRLQCIGFPSVHLCDELPVTWRMRLRWMPSAASCLAWCALCVALARPQLGQEQIQNATHGIAIEMVLDRSGSMRAEMEYGGRVIRRLDIVKQVFLDFVNGSSDGTLRGRPDDLVGIVSFARYPSTACPLTLDHGALAFAVSEIALAEGDENSTAIGDGVALAVARLHDAETTMAAQTGKSGTSYHIKNKVVIVLTDGQDEGEHTRSIAEAAELASEYGIRVYSIAIVGDPSAQAPVGWPFGGFGMNFEYDTSEIEAMSQKTGGIFRKVSNGEELKDVYKEIDELEKSEMESLRFVTHRELYIPFALAALVLMLAGRLAGATVFRRIA